MIKSVLDPSDTCAPRIYKDGHKPVDVISAGLALSLLNVNHLFSTALVGTYNSCVVPSNRIFVTEHKTPSHPTTKTLSPPFKTTARPCNNIDLIA